jgi:hypothetical protein
MKTWTFWRRKPKKRAAQKALRSSQSEEESQKKKREEQANKEVALGTQHTIPDMTHTRSGAKPGKTPKGGPPLPPLK